MASVARTRSPRSRGTALNGSASPRTAARIATLAEAAARDLALGTGNRGAAKRGRGGRTAPAAAAAPAQRRGRTVAPPGMKANVTDKLQAAAPAFGEVLKSIGTAVAATQAAMDDAALESLKELAKQTVDVPVILEQLLDDDGLPTDTNIITEKVTLASIIPPSMKQVERMTMRMDLTVGEFNATGGVKFNSRMSTVGANFSFFNRGISAENTTTGVRSEFQQLSEFSTGSVSVAVEIGERTGFQIPTPAQYAIGPQIRGAITASAQTTPTAAAPEIRRSVTMQFSIRLINGTLKTPIALTDVEIQVPAGISIPAGTVSGSVLTQTFERVVPTLGTAYVEREVRVTFGQLTRTFKISL
jgi:hypothetical protein